MNQDFSPGVAAVLSFFIPGAGQIYKGQILNGIVWLIAVAVGYLLLIIPGLILHLFCIIGAASGKKPQPQQTVVYVQAPDPEAKQNPNQ